LFCLQNCRPSTAKVEKRCDLATTEQIVQRQKDTCFFAAFTKPQKIGDMPDLDRTELSMGPGVNKTSQQGGKKKGTDGGGATTEEDDDEVRI